MDFPRWIRNFSKRYKNRGFQSEVKKEKQQKYLFRNSWLQTHTKRWGIFREKKRALKPFTNFFQEKIVKHTLFFIDDHRILGYIGVVLILLCVYIFTFSPYFQISPSKVLIESSSDWLDINIAYRSIEDIYGKNLFLFDEATVALNLRKYQNNIEKISIDRLYPNGLKIIIEGYPLIYRATITGRENKFWWLSANGVLVPVQKEKLEWLQSFEIITKIWEDELLDHKTIIPDIKLSAIIKIVDILKQQWPDLKLWKIRYLTEENEVHLSLENGGRILFALQDFIVMNTKKEDIYLNLKNQLLTLKSYIVKNRSILDSDGLSYIDVRIPGKLFICKIKEICTNNMRLIYWENYQ